MMTSTDEGASWKHRAIRQRLEQRFRSQAAWRRRTALRFSDQDDRNSEAATLLEQLSTTVKDVGDAALRKYVEVGGEDDALHQEMTRAVGFSSYPTDAESYLVHFVLTRMRKLEGKVSCPAPERRVLAVARR